jgi:hypothetical protein
MTTTAKTPTYTAGQTVSFQGRPGLVLEARKGAADMYGDATQILRVKTYAGTWLIGSKHSELKAGV